MFDNSKQFRERKEELKKKIDELKENFIKDCYSVEHIDMKSNEHRSLLSKYFISNINLKSRSLFYTKPHNNLFESLLEVNCVYYIPAIKLKYISKSGEIIISSIKNCEEKFKNYTEQAQFGDIVNKTTKTDKSVRDSLCLNNVELLLPSYYKKYKFNDELFIKIMSEYNKRTNVSFSIDIKDILHKINIKPLEITKINFDDNNIPKFLIRKNNSNDSNHMIDPTYVNNLELKNIFKNIQDTMLSGRKAKFIPHSLNIYDSNNGHFKAHVDSPRHDTSRMVGTIIFLLQQNKLNLFVNDMQYVDEDKNNKYLQYIFLFADVVHKIQASQHTYNEIKRITLTYDVILDDLLDVSIPLLNKLTKENPVNKLYGSLMYTNSNKNVAFCLQNKYTLDAIRNMQNNLNNKQLLVEIMKCEDDYKLYQALLSDNYKVQVILLMVISDQKRFNCNEYTYKNNYENYKDLKTIIPKQDIPSINITENGDEILFYDKFQVCILDYNKEKVPKIDLLINPLNCLEIINEKEKHISIDSYFTGNEYHDAIEIYRNCIYHSVALCIFNNINS